MTGNVTYSLYHLLTGKILRSGTCISGDLLLQRHPDLAPGEQAVYPDALDDEEWYLPGGVPTERPALSVTDTIIQADGEDHLVADDLPEGTEATAAGHTFVVEGGFLEVSSLEPGEFRIHIVPPFPYREIEITVTAQ